MKEGWKLVGAVRHRVAIAGRVVDADTEKPLGDADVKIIGMPDAFELKLEFAALAYGGRSAAGNGRGAQPTKWDKMLERPDRTQSKPNGLFYFLDLPEGDYSLQVAMPSLGRRFGTVEVPAKVPGKAEDRKSVPLVKCALPPTLVRGKVTDAGKKTGIPLARVRVKGSGERAFTNAEGQYTVARIESSEKERWLVVSAQGYVGLDQKFKLLKPGDSKTVPDIPLTRENG